MWCLKHASQELIIQSTSDQAILGYSTPEKIESMHSDELPALSLLCSRIRQSIGCLTAIKLTLNLSEGSRWRMCVRVLARPSTDVLDAGGNSIGWQTDAYSIKSTNSGWPTESIGRSDFSNSVFPRTVVRTSWSSVGSIQCCVAAAIMVVI